MQTLMLRKFVALVFALLVVPGLFAQNNPIPFVSEPLSPDAAAPGSAAFTLTVRGASFVPTSVVQWNGSPRATTFVSSAVLQAAITATDIASANTGVVTVQNPAPGGGTSAPVFFQVAIPAPSLPPFASSIVTGTTGGSLQVTGDFNNDAKFDLAYVTSAAAVSILLGNGDGTFTAGPTYALPTSPTSVDQILSGDFDGDGNLDLIVAFPTDSGEQDYIMLGKGDGTFQAPAILAGLAFARMAAADLDGDGILDLVGIGPNLPPSSRVIVAVGLGHGFFLSQFAYDFTNFAGGSTPRSVALGDVDGDGVADLVVAVLENSSNGVTLLAEMQGAGNGTFANPVAISSTTIPGTFSRIVTLGDFNGDGKPDIVDYSTATLTGGELNAFLGNGDGTFQAPVTTRNLPALVGSPALGDFNGDNKLDLALGATVFIGSGDGTFPNQVVLPPPSNDGNGFVAAADFNDDGKLDLVVGTDQLYAVLQAPSPSGDFGGGINPLSQTVVAGQNTSYTITLVPQNGFSSPVTLSASGLPAGATATFSANPVTGGSGPSVMTVIVPSTTDTGIFTITIHATTETAPNLIFHNGTVQLTVNPPTPDFTGSVAPNSQTVTAGQTASYPIRIIPLNGFTGNVTMSATGLPSGATPSFTSNPIAGGAGSTTLNITTSSSTPPGHYSITLTGTSGGLTHSSNLILDVNGAGTFTGSVKPGFQNIAAGSSAAFNITIISLDGFTGIVNLTATGAPAGSTASFSTNSISGSGSSVLTVTTPPTLPKGEYPVTVSATSSGKLLYTTVYLEVD